MTKAPSIIESFDDNGTVERIEGLLENLDQRAQLNGLSKWLAFTKEVDN